MTSRSKTQLVAVIGLAVSSVFPLAAAAKDLAIILSGETYLNQPQAPASSELRRLERGLRDAGFAIEVIRDLNADDLVRQVERLVPVTDTADRLFLFISGHIVETDEQSWFLAKDAPTPTRFNIGSAGLPIAPLFDLAGQYPGAAAIGVAVPRRPANISQGVSVGMASTPIPQGVSVFSGPVEELVGVMVDRVLSPGMPLGEVARASRSVRAAGYLPNGGSFLDVRAAAVVADPKTAAEDAEKALGLTGNDRRRVQRSLALLGFDPRGIDGVFGPGTRAAIRGWQGEQGIDGFGYLNEAQVAAVFRQADKRAAQLEEEARRKQAEEDARDAAYWRATGQGADEAGLRSYLGRYPDGLFSDIASGQLEDIEKAKLGAVSPQERDAWAFIENDDSSDAYQSYLDRYPNGAFADEAEARKAARLETEAQAQHLLRYEAEEQSVAGSNIARNLVENRLQALGLKPGEVDGTFTEETRKALRRFQKARGLEETGYVNQPTMVRLLLGG